MQLLSFYHTHTHTHTHTQNEDGTLRPCLTHPDIPEAYNEPRQRLPAAYCHNGSVDVIRAKVISDQNSVTGKVWGEREREMLGLH